MEEIKESEWGLPQQAEILRRTLVERLDEGLRYVDYRISRLYGGIFGKIVNPVIYQIYAFLGKKEIRRRALRQIDILIECASIYKSKNDGKVLDEYLDEYLENDESWVRRKWDDPKLREILREVFKMRVESLSMVLVARGDTYDALIRDAFPDRGKAQEWLSKQLLFVREMVSLAEEGKIEIPPLIRTEILSLIRATYNYAERRLQEELQLIYGNEDKG
jgi:hypothetical protein